MIVYTSINMGGYSWALVMLMSVNIFICSMLYVGIKFIESTTDNGSGMAQSV